MRKMIKITRLVAHIFNGLVQTFVYVGVYRWPANHPRYQQAKQEWLSRVCRILGLEVHVHGEAPQQTVLYAANHISWLDIPLVASLGNPHFLSKQAVRHWPVIGWLAEKSGTLFIKRGENGSASSAGMQIANCLSAAESVLIFPEGTTTIGTDVRRFHGRLFAAAIETGTPVQPVAIRYLDEQGNHDQMVPFVDHEVIARNLWKLLGRKKINAEVYFLDLIDIHGQQRNAIARECESRIRDKILSEDTLSGLR